MPNENTIEIDALEPKWIRDPNLAVVDLDTSDPEKIPEIMAAICEGEKNFCEHCGKEFPLWPTKEWADHIITEHDLTIFARTSLAPMCSDELNPVTQMFFSVQFGTRTALRRRAWKLGKTVVKPGKIVH